jgi:outer membrane receptor protein involved in Fe transport
MNKTQAVLVSAVCLGAPPTAAFGQLEEILVTAQRRVESLQDVPISVTAVTGDAILEGGFSDVEDLARFVPNLWMQDTFTGQVLAIRGIGTTAGNEAFESAVAIFHDDVYYGRDNLGQNASFDLERVEILRGPQPIYFGQSATAGALNVTSRTPGDSWEGNLQLAYGDDEELNFEAGVGGPLSDTFGIRFSGRYYDLGTNHYFNPLIGQDQAVKENAAFRTVALWEPSERVRARFKYEYQDIWQLGTAGEWVRCDLNPATSLANPGISPGFNALCALDIAAGVADITRLDGALGSQGHVDIYDRVAQLNAGLTPGSPGYWGDGTRNLRSGAPLVPGGGGYIRPNLDEVYEFTQDEERQFDSNVLSARIDFDIGENLTLTSTTSYVDYDKQDWLDPDASSLAVFTDLRIETFEQKSQELRLQSGADQFFSWMAGLYWQEHDLDSTLNIYAGSLLGARPNVQPNSAAASYGVRLLENSEWQALFFAGTFNVSDRFRFNVGGRYQDVAKSATQLGSDAYLSTTATAFGPRTVFATATPSIEFDEFLPEVGAQWNASDDFMLYVKYSEAFKMGGFVVAPPIGGSIDSSVYLPEEAEGSEIGFKSTLLDGNLQFNLAYYDADYTNLQVSVFVAEGAGLFVTTNAAAAETKGFEWDGRWALGDSFFLGFTGSKAEATYTDYAGAECNSLQDKIWTIVDNTPATPGLCRQDLSGVRISNHPEWTFGLQPEYTFALGENFVGTLSANLFFSDGYELAPTSQGDPISFIDDWHRLDARFAVGPEDGDWQIALYARDLTDERVPYNAGARNFQSRSRLIDYDAGAYTADRGRRVGIQFNYLFGQ